MKTHTTNYLNTFIEVAEDTKVTAGRQPEPKGDKKTIAELQYELIKSHPYKYTSDDVIFQVFAERNQLAKSEYDGARAQFFSKGQPCMRTSPLTKTHGFGVHADSEGRVAIYGIETPEYEKFVADKNIAKVKAMRSTKAK